MNMRRFLSLCLVASFAVLDVFGDDCFDPSNRNSYRGTISNTAAGIKCQEWNSQKPHAHKFKPAKYPDAGLEENYCRNPDNDPYGPWCYTIKNKKRWQYCLVPTCPTTTTKPVVTTTKPIVPPSPGKCGVPVVPMADNLKGLIFRDNPVDIVGGITAVHGSIPWQVSLRMTRKPNFLFCGGSLLNNDWIITATHCISKPQDPRLYLGVLGEYDITKVDGTEKTVSFQLIFNHESYDKTTLLNDITVMKMDQPVAFTDYIKPVCLPKAKSVPKHNSAVIVSGWGNTQGTTQDDKLNQVTVPVIKYKQCKDFGGYYDDITTTMLCAGYKEGGKDSCQGDSGGPLVQKVKDEYELIGIVSWGIGCAKKKSPGVYTMVSMYVDWINDKIKNN